MDSRFDCLIQASVCKVICKYYVHGVPDKVYQMPFTSLGKFDDWRYQTINRNKVVVSLHIMYDYPESFKKTLPYGDSISQAENRSIFE